MNLKWPAEDSHSMSGSGMDLPLPYLRKQRFASSTRQEENTFSLPERVVSFLSQSSSMEVDIITAIAAVLIRYGASSPFFVGAGQSATSMTRIIGINTSRNSSLLRLRNDVAATLATSNGQVAHSCNILVFPSSVKNIPNHHQDISIIYSASGDLELRASYAKGLFDASAITTLLTHISTFIEVLATRNLESISAIDYMSATEKTALISCLSGPCRSISSINIDVLFRGAANLHGEQPAVILGDRQFTYSEINEQSNRLAHLLKSRGVQENDRVGICLLPGPEQIISLMAIIKLRATVVPFDWTFPTARLRAMTRTAAVRTTIADAHLAAVLPTEANMTHIEELKTEIDRFPTTDIGPKDEADCGLYILFTSGSTGDPKAVVMPHSSIANLIDWQNLQTPAYGKRTLNRTSLAFDVGHQEIFSTLCFGGTLVIATDRQRQDISTLHRIVAETKIQRLFLPPVALQQMAESVQDDATALASLENVVVSGEQLRITPAIVRMFRAINARLTNQYGPTETHVATECQMVGSSIRWPSLPAIGRPIQNTRLYIVNEHCELVPKGVTGDILIGGAGLSNGYYGRPDLTDEQFWIDPFNEDEAARVYNTGDRGKLDPTDEIIFLGRCDDQVKLRGYRIELGDIESHALAITGVRNAAARIGDAATNPYIALYVEIDELSWDKQYGQSAHDTYAVRQLIRNELKARLPEHMIPGLHAIALIPQIPLTVTGKIDRRALPELLADQSSNTTAAGMMDAIRNIWTKHLRIPSIDPNDDFLDIGGHSLVAIQIVAEVNDHFGTSVPLSTLLRGGRLSDFAMKVSALIANSHSKTGHPRVDENKIDSELVEVALPDGKVVFAPSLREASYLWRDVVELDSYLRFFPKLPADSIIFDVGAHIGLFTLQALHRLPNSAVFAFEPASRLYQALTKNISMHANRVRTLQVGCGSKTTKEATFTYYPRIPAMSSFFPNLPRDAALLHSIIRNTAQITHFAQTTDDVIRGELISHIEHHPVRTLDSILQEWNIEHVDLLKIDVQRGELDVIQGIGSQWRKIRNLIIELQDDDGICTEVTNVLRTNGFRVEVQQLAELHSSTNVQYIKATRD